jgi:signal transduction histidine kinase
MITTFRGRMLVTLLFLSISPLILVLYFAMYSSEQILTTTKEKIEKNLLNYVTYLHQENLDKQAERINEQLDSVKKQVQIIRSVAKDIFSNGVIPVDYELHLTKEREGYYWENVEGDVSNVGVSAITDLSLEIQKRLMVSKSLEPLFKKVVQQNPHVAAIYYIGPQSYWRIYPKLNVNEEVANGYLTPDIDLTTKDFYSLAFQSPNKEAIWTSTYKDPTHRKEVFSLSTPLYHKNGEFLGIIGADITISQTLKHILNIQFKEPSAYALLINKYNQIIAYQPKTKQDLPYLTPDIRRKMFLSEKPFFAKINNRTRVVLVSSVKNTNWKLVFVIPKEEIIYPVKEVTKQELKDFKESFSLQFISLTLLTTLILVTSSFAIWKHFTRPMQELLNGISSISARNFQTKVNEQSLEEFYRLSHSFNTMAEKINELFTNYQLLNSQLEEKVRERTSQLTIVNKSLQQTNKKLQQLEQTRKEMFENIAHDLKTPMTLVLGYIEAIQDGMVHKDKIDEYLKRIHHHLESINHLVKGIYELNNIEVNRNTFHFEIINTNQFFTHMKDSWKNHPHIHFSIKEHLPSLKMDVKYMERALFNLIDNAIKYSDTQSPIILKVEEAENSIVITLRDFGWGIPEKDLPHIFKRFYRVDKARNSNKPGNGLGLAIVKEIIHAHGGKINVTSKLGEGTTFIIFLPCSFNN